MKIPNYGLTITARARTQVNPAPIVTVITVGAVMISNKGGQGNGIGER